MTNPDPAPQPVAPLRRVARPPKKGGDPYRPMWFIAFALTGLLAFSGISHWIAPKESIPWREDFTAAQAEARESGKTMFVYFTAEWCGPCRSMNTTTWADGDVAKALQGYVATRVDVDRNMELAQDYQVQSVPQMYLMDAEGSVLRQLTKGAVDAEEFLGWLKE